MFEWIEFCRPHFRRKALRYLSRCGALIRFGACLPALAAAATTTPLTLQISNETAPAGGFVQFKISATAPALIASGNLSMDFDPSIFGPIAQLSVFSATGDQIGYANVSSEHLDVHFSSPSAGIGQLPQLPVFTVSLPVLASVAPGSSASITASISSQENIWTDPQRNQYTVTVTPGTFTVGGSLSVRALTPSAGVLPEGTVIQLSGTGFDSATVVTIDGVSISTFDFANSGQINLTLGGATEMTGKSVHVSNSAGAQIDYYAAAPSAPIDPLPQNSPLEGVQAIMPLATYTGVQMNNTLTEDGGAEGLGLFNPNLNPVTVMLAGFGALESVSPQLLYFDTLSIAPSQLSLIDANKALTSLPLTGEIWVTTSAPVRFISIQRLGLPDPITGQVPTSVSIPPQITSPEPPIQITLTPSTSSASWSCQIGTPAPAPATVALAGNFGFSTSISGSAAQWLSVSSASNGQSSTLTLTPNPCSLAAGIYTGTVTVTPIAPDSLNGVPVIPVTISVTLAVTGSPMISYSPAQCCIFVLPGPNAGGGLPDTLTIVSNGNPVQITISATSDTNWLAVSPLSGTTPLQLTVTANPAGLNLAPGYHSGQISIQGLTNTVAVMAQLNVLAPPPHGTTLLINGPPPAFTLTAGTQPSNSAAAFISFQEFDVALTSVETNVPWLSAVIQTPGPGPPASVLLYPNSAGLSPGVYSGAITITSSNYPVLTVPATLTVLATPTAQTALTASPASLSFAASVGGTNTSQNLAISFNGEPVQFNITGGQQWLQLLPAPGFTSAAPVYTVTAAPTGLSPGTYYTGLVVDWTTGSITIPVIFSITPTAGSPPVIAGIVNSASDTPGAIAPGEIVSIFGSGIGGAPTGAQLDASGEISTNLSQTQLLIGGIAAPLLYASASQVNAIVPYGVRSSGTVTVQVISSSITSATWDVPLASVAPAVFTANSTGVGQAAVLNQDNSVNSPSNPAPPGTTIQIFATGGGETVPPSITGALAPPGEILDQSVQVTIRGLTAVVSYAGAAPGEVNGLVQINAVIPQGIAPGTALPITVTVGNIPAPGAITVAVE